jgi:hypothetical protein
MKRTVVTAGVLGLLGVSSAFAEDAKIAVTSDRISLFEVALRCEAAPEIGCGSRSKPVLLQLEREPMITEAWIVAFQEAVAKGICPLPEDQEEAKTKRTVPDCCSLQSTTKS